MENPRIEDLKRRIQKDPASIVFAQLGEEYRRAGRSREAIEICRAGLKRHPAYLSARVTLGRALLDIGELEQSEHELKQVLQLAPENLAARRGVADALERRGDQAGALAHYEIALALAPRDVDLQSIVSTLRAALQALAAPMNAEIPAQGAAPEGRPNTAAATPRVGSTSEPPAILDPVLPVLERWLDFIVADRQQRAAMSAPAANL